MKNIFRLLAQNFVQFVMISFAIPAPHFLIHDARWLEEYKYKITLSRDLFMIEGALPLGHCVDNDQLPGHQRGAGQPHTKIERRVGGTLL
ncbi:MAG TPA: hypothetical protein VFW11_02945 [Cyclobacteriaceae bacterium]|nr:hypothetical protein [Cyclobacteriaceae bacterium]